MSATTERERYKYRVLWGAAMLFALSLALAGGSSRGDVMAFLAVQVAAVLVLLAMLLSVGPRGMHAGGLPLAFLGAIAALAIVQLVPLPPEIWRHLPGRAFYAGAARAAGLEQPWRPLSLSPDLTAESLVGLLPLFAAGVLFGLGPRKFAHGAVLGLLVIAVVSVVLAAFQMSAGPDSELRFYHFTNTDSGVGLLANRNHQAVLLAMAIPAAAEWALRPGPMVTRPAARLTLAGCMILLFLAGCVMTGSRTGLILCGVALLATVALCWPFFGRLPAAIKGGAVAGLAIGAAAVVLFSVSGQRLLRHSAEADPRAWFWPRTVELIKEFFPFGAGMGTIERVYPRVEALGELTPEYVNHAHNDWLEIGYEAGLFAYGLFAAFLAWWALHAWRAWRARPGMMADLALARLATVILALGVLGSATDYPLRTPLLGCVMCIAGALLWRLSRPAPAYSPAA